MQFQKILKKVAVLFLIICIVLIVIDLFKILKINFNFINMQSSERISSINNADAIKYEPTDYIITNKEDALEEIKKITMELKKQYINSNKKEDLFEIANINKIENFFYEYEKYAIVKYKLLNIIEDLPKLYKNTKGYSDNQLKSYFEQNSVHIESYYGIKNSSDFVNLAKSLDFLDNSGVKLAVVLDSTINFDYENDVLTFNMRISSNNDKRGVYLIKSEYYKTSDNQVTPYVSFKVNN